MNIALTSLYLPSGSKIGVGYQVHFLANALVQRGHHVTVFSQTGKSPDSLYDVTVIEPRRRARTFGFAWDLRKIDFSPFDVLNAHGDDWFLWGKHRPRHIHTFHGSCFAEMLNAHGLAGKLRMAALAACEYNSLLLPDETVAVSENTRRYIPGIRHIIPCGVDTNAFAPPADGVRNSNPTLLFVGTIHGRKRGQMLLDIFRKQIRPKLPTAEMWCVCDKPDHEQNGDGIKFTGRIPQDELTDLYRRAWIFCLPSTYEGFGVPYVEAMASGLPVIASPNPGAVEVTRNGTDGIISKDPDLADHLLRLLTDKPERDRLATAGLTRSRDFSWPTICERYEKLYHPPQTTRITAAMPPVAHASSSSSSS